MLETLWEVFTEGLLPVGCVIGVSLLLVIFVIGGWMWCVTTDTYDGIKEGDIVCVVNMPSIQGKVQWYNRLTETYCVRIIDYKGVPRTEDYEREEIQLVKVTKPEKGQ